MATKKFRVLYPIGNRYITGQLIDLDPASSDARRWLKAQAIELATEQSAEKTEDKVSEADEVTIEQEITPETEPAKKADKKKGGK